MNNRRFGLISTRGREIEFLSRDDFLSERVQSFLSVEYAHGRRMQCLCRAERPVVYVYQNEQNGLHWLRRESVSDRHGEGCPVPIAYLMQKSGRRPSILYTDAIFGRGPQSSAPIEADPGVSTVTEDMQPACRYEDFTHFCNTVFLGISVGECLCDTRTGGASGRFSDRARQVFGGLLFSGGDTLKSVLEAMGKNISFGITTKKVATSLLLSPLPNGQLISFPLGRSGSDVLDRSPAVVYLDRYIADNLAGRIRTWDHIIGPPYFYVLVHGGKPVSLASRLFLQPVIASNGSVFAIESEFERLFATMLISQQVAFRKPKRLSDLDGSAVALSHYWGQRKWLPDFILDFGDVHVLAECAGQRDSEYSNHLAEKLRFYETLCRYGVRHIVVRHRNDLGSPFQFSMMSEGVEVNLPSTGRIRSLFA